MSQELPLVSIAMIAYNVEQYLGTAIESVLRQKTDFKIQLVIGEDCSTDGTREIAIKYRDQYPDIIKLILHEKNQGLTPNSVCTQNACTGKYIALLDGDDYWTDDYKLQKQVEFLEKSQDFSASAHQAEIVYDHEEGKNRPFGELNDAVYTVLDTIQHRKFHTSSLVYAKSIWDKVGGIPTTISSNERAIYPMLATFGKIKYFKESMCIYRLSSGGLSSRITSEELETDMAMIPWLKNIDPNFPYLRFRSFLHLCIYTYPAQVSIRKAFKHCMCFIYFSFSYFPNNLGDAKHGLIEFIRILKQRIRLIYS